MKLKTNTAITKRFIFRTVRVEDAEATVQIEQICFPPHEACSRTSMIERIGVASDLFLLAVDKTNGKIAGFLNGIATNEEKFRDEFFTDATLHEKDGKNIMLLGLDVLPEYEHQGLAHEIMYQYAIKEAERGREALYLTCLDQKVTLYEEMGYVDLGVSDSVWGGEAWHDMKWML